MRQLNSHDSRQIQIELVKQLFRQIEFALWAESLAAVGLTLALWHVQDHTLLLSWLIFNLVFAGLFRHCMVFIYWQQLVRIDLSYDRARFWLYIFTLGVIFSGISWGLAGSVLMVKGTIQHQTFLVFLLIGVTSAANPFYSPYRRVYAIFLLLAFVPFAVWLFMQGGIFIILGALALVYTAIMIASSFYSHYLLYTSLNLRYQRTELLENLSSAKDALENRSRELEKSLSLLKATLEATTNGILVVNTKNQIENYNQKFIDMWKLPADILKQHDVRDFIEFVRPSLIDAASFYEKFVDPCVLNETEVFDEIAFKNGNVFERYSHPQYVGDKCVGTVWSFRDVTGRKFMEAKLFHQANFDSLTNLPNRALVLDRITHAIIFAHRYNLSMAILFLDLDRFKLINDTLGHTIGDKLLKEVASRLVKCVREDDTVSREGGDEFLIILNSLKHEEDAAMVARKCLEALKDPFLIDGNKINSTISIGISIYPKDGQDSEVLIRNADIAMYRAKELGRSNFQFFTQEMNQKVLTRSKMENQLRDALAHNEFNLVYQPIVDLRSKQVISIEALLRWKHPQLGSISPVDFIPVAEDSGVIIPISQWMMTTAFSQLKHWHDLGFKSLKIGVNISQRQFRQANFYEFIERLCEQIKIDPHYLIFELTESMVMEDLQKNIIVLNKLKSVGITIVIDDFGVGYSSLAYLKQLPVDKVKIDRSFTKDILIHEDDAAITVAIIALAGKLNLKVIAEGVENRNQLKFLIDHACDEIQGFYVTKPLEAEEFTKWLFKNKDLIGPSITTSI